MQHYEAVLHLLDITEQNRTVGSSIWFDTVDTAEQQQPAWLDEQQIACAQIELCLPGVKFQEARAVLHAHREEGLSCLIAMWTILCCEFISHVVFANPHLLWQQSVQCLHVACLLQPPASIASWIPMAKLVLDTLLTSSMVLRSI